MESNATANVTLMTVPLFETAHNFETGPLEKLFSFTCFNHGVFKVYARKVSSSILGKFIEVTILQDEENPDYRVHIEVTTSGNRPQRRVTVTATVNKHHPTSEPLFLKSDQFVAMRMEFEVDDCDKRKMPNSLVADLKPFLDEGPKVTLVGSDGQVAVPKLLLEIRSPALKAMFSHDVQENESLTIDLKDFNVIVLQSFSNFLYSDDMEEDNATAIGLYILADKYDVKLLKHQAEKFILDNIEDFDRDEVFDVMVKIGQPKLKQLFNDRYPDSNAL